MQVASLLKQLIRVGTLEIIGADGRTRRCVGTPGLSVAIRVHDRRLERRLLEAGFPRSAGGAAAGATRAFSGEVDFRFMSAFSKSGGRFCVRTRAPSQKWRAFRAANRYPLSLNAR